MSANFLTGPVALRQEVRAAFDAAPVSHRDQAFLERLNQTRSSLRALVNAPQVALLIGSGTLANDAVAAQLTGCAGPGLILSNGEFGDRLIDHARRWNLTFAVHRESWGHAFDWAATRTMAARLRPHWLWAVLAETSTGVLNPLGDLRALAAGSGADLCVDAISAVGLMPVDLADVRFATAVSGKGLAAFPGLAAVFHDGRLADPARIPRYLDLAAYQSADGVPYTHSSNLVAALHGSLSLTDWAMKFARVRRQSCALRAELRRLDVAPLAADAIAAPGILTIPLERALDSGHIAQGLRDAGIEVAWQSGYLRERNWLQVALMGEVDEPALQRLPTALQACQSSSRTRDASQSSFGRPLQRYATRPSREMR
jgi:aspartate aminotransferase-like enzyme